MELSLSWDLLLVVFFAVIVAYSFIVGKDESVKIIIASYIAIVSTQAIGNILMLLNVESARSWIELFGFGLNMDIISSTKLILFVAMIIFLAIRGGFEMQYATGLSGVWEPVVTGALGFVTAGLLLTALLTYIAAKPLLDSTLGQAPLLQPLLQGSTLVPMMVNYQNVWFCLPALLLLTVGFIDTHE